MHGRAKLVTIITLALFALYAAPATAQLQAATIEPQGLLEVKTSAYVLNIGKFEIATGSYTVDFYLGMKCDRPCSPGGFEFINGRATSIDKLIDTPTEKFYRIQAALSQNIDLRQYPFDRHSLLIAIEDKARTTEDQVYVLDEESSGIDPGVVIVGWQLDGWRARVAEHYYQPYDETFSQFVFEIDISRVGLTSAIKSFLPVFFMVFVALLTLLLRADKVTTRLTLNISTLLAAVLFHLNLTSSIPPTGYLTFADRFMITTYVILLTVLFSGILLMRHTEGKNEAMANRIYKTALYAIPVFTVLIYALLFLLI